MIVIQQGIIFLFSANGSKGIQSGSRQKLMLLLWSYTKNVLLTYINSGTIFKGTAVMAVMGLN